MDPAQSTEPLVQPTSESTQSTESPVNRSPGPSVLATQAEKDRDALLIELSRKTLLYREQNLAGQSGVGALENEIVSPVSGEQADIDTNQELMRLFSYVTGEDQIVSHTATKCTVAFIGRCSSQQELMFCQHIVSSMANPIGLSQLTSTLCLCTHLLTASSTRHLTHCLSMNWLQVLEVMQSVSDALKLPTDRERTVALVSFLSLWIKMVKRTPDRSSEDADLSSKDARADSEFLVSLLRRAGEARNCVVQNRALQLMARIVDKAGNEYLQKALRTGFCEDLWDRLYFRAGRVGFGGCQDEPYCSGGEGAVSGAGTSIGADAGCADDVIGTDTGIGEGTVIGAGTTGTDRDDVTGTEGDRIALRLSVHLALLCISDARFKQTTTYLDKIQTLLGTKLPNTTPLKPVPSCLRHLLFSLFMDEDCGLVAMLLHTLHIYSSSLNGGQTETVMEAHLYFLDFIEKISYDADVLVDFLSSPETVFLEYLLTYLKLATRNFDAFLVAHETQITDIFPVLSNTDQLQKSEVPMSKTTALVSYSDSDSDTDGEENSRNSRLERTVTLLASLRGKLERLSVTGVFPYNPQPLISKLVTLEKMCDSSME